MTREKLIQKRLDERLTPEEAKAFQALEDASELNRLFSAAARLEVAAPYDTEKELAAVLEKLPKKQKTIALWKKILIPAAAMIAICLGIVHYTTSEKTIATLASEKTELQLPDGSTVYVNTESTVRYSERNWDNKRTIHLEGEAYFDVAKGSTFTVNTPSGTVTVLGTEFNIKQRNKTFEVVCYAGSVAVRFGTEKSILQPKDKLLILEKSLVSMTKEATVQPVWIEGRSVFKSTPYGAVIDALEKQFGVQIQTIQVDQTQLFTGSFVHDDLMEALKTISLPLQLNYEFKNSKTIVLSRE